MSYVRQLAALTWGGVTSIVCAPTHSQRADARRRLARHWLWCVGLGGAAIIALMFVVDGPEISLMPARGAAYLWPVRILTDFGKAAYVLMALAAVTIITLVLAPLWSDPVRTRFLGLSKRFGFLFLAVAVPIEVGEWIKGIVGRGRPFVGGVANPFNYSHFTWTEAYASFPSGHANTSAALAFAVCSLWPRAGYIMWPYVVVIVATRLVLLAHHPSDVLAGVLVGVIGAMAVRYWFASRHLLFSIGSDGAIHPVPGPSSTQL
jgi:undecaprenyl-diphosphatase